MTPAERRSLIAVIRLLVAASVEADEEMRQAAIEEAVRRLVGLVRKGVSDDNRQG